MAIAQARESGEAIIYSYRRRQYTNAPTAQELHIWMRARYRHMQSLMIRSESAIKKSGTMMGAAKAQLESKEQKAFQKHVRAMREQLKSFKETRERVAL